MVRDVPGLKRRLKLGLFVWLASLILLRPSLLEPVWATLLLLLAALVLVPLAHMFIEPGKLWGAAAVCQSAAAVNLTVALLLPGGLLATLLVLPWLIMTALLALAGLNRLRRRGLRPWSELAIDAGLIYLFVGGIWTLLARLGARPLGFSDEIVMLTAVHFHYAGFTLPILCGLAARQQPGRLAAATVMGVVVGVPLVAVGITASQFGAGLLVETLAAWLTAGGGLLVAGLYGRLSLDRQYQPVVRALWGVTAVSLAVGMVLAALYGSRALLPLPWLTIPWMRAIHGTANSLGFSLAGLLGWVKWNSNADDAD